MVSSLFLLADLGIIFGGIWLCVVICRWGRPKPPKRQDHPIPPGLREFYEEPPPPPRVTKTRPPVHYIPRWGLYRKHSVAADKAQWEKEFSRLAPPTATAPERDRESTPPSAPPPAPTPAPTPDEVFTGLRKRLSDLGG